MISFPEAQQLVIGQARSFGKEKVYLDNAIGRVVAERIVADRDYPPFNRAAMDGYAIRHSDWEAGRRSFVIRETIFAGSISQLNIEKGECYRIMTGAAVPECADTVIRREDVLEKSDAIECLLESLNKYQHIAKRGEDLRKDESLSSAAVMCSPAITGLLASIGKNEVLVERLPNVAIITTGDEVVNIDQPVNSVQIRNSNSHLLKAFLKKWNIVVSSCVHVEDQVDKIESTLKAALSVDIIIICGGVSAGDADHVPSVLDHLGAKKIFHKVSIKPGKPIWFGNFDNGPTVFALPGNPLSCMVTFKLFIEFFLSHSFGLGEPQQLSLRLNGCRSKKTQLDEFFPVQIISVPSQFEIITFNGSGDITAAIQADAIARHPAAMTELLSGIVVHAYPLF